MSLEKLTAKETYNTFDIHIKTPVEEQISVANLARSIQIYKQEYPSAKLAIFINAHATTQFIFDPAFATVYDVTTHEDDFRRGYYGQVLKCDYYVDVNNSFVNEIELKARNSK